MAERHPGFWRRRRGWPSPARPVIHSFALDEAASRSFRASLEAMCDVAGEVARSAALLECDLETIYLPYLERSRVQAAGETQPQEAQA